MYQYLYQYLNSRYIDIELYLICTFLKYTAKQKQLPVECAKILSEIVFSKKCTISREGKGTKKTTSKKTRHSIVAYFKIVSCG